MLVKEYIDFERGQEPLKSMGVGMEAKLRDWLKKSYGVPEASDDQALHYAIMAERLDFIKYLVEKNTPITEAHLNLAFRNKVKDEIILYLIAKGDPTIIDYVKSKRKRLKLMDEAQNFERNQDPHQTLKIGLKSQILDGMLADNWTREWDVQEALGWSAFTGNKKYVEFCIESGADPAGNGYEAFMEAIKEGHLEVADYIGKVGKFNLMDIINHFKKIAPDQVQYVTHYQRSLKDPDFRRKIMAESQNFERKPLDKETLGIGLEATINEFMEDHSGEQPGSWVYDILDNSNLELDTDTRKKWAQFLITMPKKYATEDDENLYYVLKQNNIEWIPYLPIMGNDFGYTVEGDKYYLHFGGWLDFRDLFDSHSRDVSLEFIGSVLSGEDSYEHFERDMDEYEDITQYAWYLSKTEEKGNIPALEDLKTTALEMGADPEKVTTLNDLLDEINDNEDLESLKEAIQRAFAETQSVADEDACLKSLKSTIMKHFDLKQKPEYNEKEILVGEISKNGLKKLSYTVATGDEKIQWTQPSGSAWMGDWEPDVINDALENAMGDIG